MRAQGCVAVVFVFRVVDKTKKGGVITILVALISFKLSSALPTNFRPLQFRPRTARFGFLLGMGIAKARGRPRLPPAHSGFSDVSGMSTTHPPGH